MQMYISIQMKKKIREIVLQIQSREQKPKQCN